MNALIAKATKQLSSLEADLSLLKGIPIDQQDAGKQGIILLYGNTLGQISASITTISLTLRDLNGIISKEVNMEKRNSGKEQYRQCNEKLSLLKADFDAIRAERAEAENSKKRQDLVSFRNPNERPNPPQLESNAYYRQESTVLDYSQHQVEDFIQMGQQALENLRFQRSTFKGAEKRALDLAQRLGVSDSVIRFIQRRQGSDRIIFWCCVIGALLFLLWIIHRRIF